MSSCRNSQMFARGWRGRSCPRSSLSPFLSEADHFAADGDFDCGGVVGFADAEVDVAVFGAADHLDGAVQADGFHWLTLDGNDAVAGAQAGFGRAAAGDDAGDDQRILVRGELDADAGEFGARFL